MIAYIDQGGLTLPDRDYYIKDDAKMKDMRQHLVDYCTQCLRWRGKLRSRRRDSAQTVLLIETVLAADRWTAPSGAIRRIATTR